MPSDEDLISCLCFRGANVGNVFITTKLYLEFIFLFGLLFLSPRTRSISSPYLYNRICYGLDMDISFINKSSLDREMHSFFGYSVALMKKNLLFFLMVFKREHKRHLSEK